jgi:hypothetical protein
MDAQAGLDQCWSQTRWFCHDAAKMLQARFDLACSHRQQWQIQASVLSRAQHFNMNDVF